MKTDQTYQKPRIRIIHLVIEEPVAGSGGKSFEKLGGARTDGFDNLGIQNEASFWNRSNQIPGTKE